MTTLVPSLQESKLVIETVCVHALHYNDDFTFLSFGNMCSIVEF